MLPAITALVRGPWSARAADPAGKAAAFFESRVRPLLVAPRYACHSGDKTKGGLSLDSRSKGGGHHPFGFTMWIAGGGVKDGSVRGATDEFGWRAVRDKIHVHVHDPHAAIPHLKGLDHERLTHRRGGRDHRLTGLSGHVVKAILA